MSMKIPDLQMVVSKANEVSRIQQATLQEHAAKRQEITAQLTAQTQMKEETVFESSPGEHALIVERQEDEKQRKNKRKQHKSEKKDSKDDGIIVDDKSGGNVDILA
ncbi:MAG: hypothetical protein GXY50_07115 [Syntrophomonadaceae bacterium]|mgnify:CR=1 FL=1|nr:hypothetical protein [Syntrophomonadaceae bacterium]